MSPGGGGNRTHSRGFRDRCASRYATPQYGAPDGSRTRTLFPAQDFKSRVSTYSTTGAKVGGLLPALGGHPL